MQKFDLSYDLIVSTEFNKLYSSSSSYLIYFIRTSFIWMKLNWVCAYNLVPRAALRK